MANGLSDCFSRLRGAFGTATSAFGRSLLAQLRPARFLSLRHLSPGRGGNVPLACRSRARLCSGVSPNKFLEGGDGLIQTVEFFLYADALFPELSQHPTEIGHHDLRFSIATRVSRFPNDGSSAAKCRIEPRSRPIVS